MSSESPELVLKGIRVSDEGVGLVQGGSYWVSRTDIDHIEITPGVLSAHPVAQFVLGVGLSIVGLMPLKYVVAWFKEGGNSFAI